MNHSIRQKPFFVLSLSLFLFWIKISKRSHPVSTTSNPSWLDDSLIADVPGPLGRPAVGYRFRPSFSVIRRNGDPLLTFSVKSMSFLPTKKEEKEEKKNFVGKGLVPESLPPCTKERRPIFLFMVTTRRSKRKDQVVSPDIDGTSSSSLWRYGFREVVDQVRVRLRQRSYRSGVGVRNRPFMGRSFVPWNLQRLGGPEREIVRPP